MPDYQLGKIYKIVDNTNNNVYIGSTCNPTLKQRLSQHESAYKSYLNGKNNYVTSFDIFKNDDYEILLVESFPCDYKDELLARERYWANKVNCINKNKNQGLINELGEVEYYKQKNKQYRKDHREQIRRYKKQYRKDHREQICRYKNTKCTCVCGGMYTLTQICRYKNTKCTCVCGGMYTLTHMKSIKHIEYVKSETIKQCLFKNLSFKRPNKYTKLYNFIFLKYKFFYI